MAAMEKQQTVAQGEYLETRRPPNAGDGNGATGLRENRGAGTSKADGLPLCAPPGR